MRLAVSHDGYSQDAVRRFRNTRLVFMSQHPMGFQIEQNLELSEFSSYDHKSPATMSCLFQEFRKSSREGPAVAGP